MATIDEYLADAIKFQAMADNDNNPELKEALENQAATHRKLAIDRATKLGIRPPELSPQSNRNANHR
jgi:hypothetical protein